MKYIATKKNLISEEIYVMMKNENNITHTFLVIYFTVVCFMCKIYIVHNSDIAKIQIHRKKKNFYSPLLFSCLKLFSKYSLGREK